MSTTIRKLKIHDYDKQYFDLLSQLTTVNSEKISRNDFNNFVNSLNDMHIVFVIEDEELNKIIATATILIEQKIIHGMGKVSHIEDVVVDVNYSGKHIGKAIIEHATLHSKNVNCYKVILDCSDDVIKFYDKCGFKKKGNQMSMYF